MTLSEAVAILGAAQHRGARWWYWDAATMRVTPSEWNGMPDDPAPTFTAFEALVMVNNLRFRRYY